MAIPVVAGATCICTMGTSPGQFNPSNQPTVRVGGKSAASIVDITPMINVMPCGMCTSMMNPAVAAATAAALGVLTPQPCVPAPTGPWICPGTVRVCGKPILTSEGRLTCAYGGSISFQMPGQTTVRTG